MWLQYLPVVIGSVWALAYFQKHRRDWDWSSNGSLLVLVSVLVAPYTWPLDQAILIPALLQAAYLTRSRGMISLLALASALVEILPLRGVPFLHSSAYLWTTPAWLLWYLFATRSPRLQNASDPPRTTSPLSDAAPEFQLLPAGGFSVLNESDASEV
jgi:hypothetical protein